MTEYGNERKIIPELLDEAKYARERGTIQKEEALAKIEGGNLDLIYLDCTREALKACIIRLFEKFGLTEKF